MHTMTPYQRTKSPTERLHNAQAEYDRFSAMTDPDPDIQEAYANRLVVLEKLIKHLT